MPVLSTSSRCRCKLGKASHRRFRGSFSRSFLEIQLALKGAHAFDSSVSEQGRTLQLAAGVGVETCSAPC